MAAVLQEPEAAWKPDVADELVRQLGAQQEQIRELELQVVNALSKVDALSKVGAPSNSRGVQSSNSTGPPSEATSSLGDNALEQLEEGTGGDASGSAEGSQSKAVSPTAITPARLDVGDSYALNMSIWDSMLFFGHPGLGGSVSAVTLLAYVLNLTFQLAFCLMIWHYMLVPDVSSSALDTLLKFRLSIAHNVEFADPISKQSLAQQLCNTNEKVHYAAGQMDILKDVKQFLNGGPQLMILAEIVFLCVIVKELDAIAQFAKAVMSLRRSRSTTVVLADSSEHDVHDPAERCKAEDLYLLSVVTRIDKIRPLRVYFAWALIIVPRLAISLFLGITGVRFIGKTNNVDDLILNCLAIAFVIDLDELIYECLAPRRLKTLMNNVEPIPCNAPEYGVTKRHVPVLSAVMKIIFMTAAVAAAYYLYLGRFFWQLEQVDHILCSQDSNLDFVYARNSANNIIYVARSKDTEDWTADEVTIMEVANLDIEPGFDWKPGILVKQQELHTGSEHSPPAVVIGHSAELVSDTEYDASIYEALEELGGMSPERAASGLVCRDLGSTKSERRSYLAALQELMNSTGNSTAINSCDDVPWQYCARREMTQLRALCPVHCNCHVPPTYEIGGGRAPATSRAGYFQSPQGGCPQSCQAQVETSNEILFVTGPSPFSGSTNSTLGTAGRCLDVGPEEIVFGGSESMSSSAECLVYEEHDSTMITVAASCSGLPSVAFWWLTFAAGLFEHLTADVTFPDIVEDIVMKPDSEISVPSNMRSALVKWISNGSMAQSFVDGNWELMPGVPHPRNLTGCDFLASFEVRMLLNIDLCGAEEYSSIRFMCPVSCGCSVGQLYNYEFVDGGVQFDLIEGLFSVSNRMEDLVSCPAACVMVHPAISGDSSYNSIDVGVDPSCEDRPGNSSGKLWSDGYNGCSAYASAEAQGDEWCTKFGESDFNGEGSAKWACCACGGGSDHSVAQCTDLAPDGATDADGDSCADWAMNEWDCSDEYDDTDFTLMDMCCQCGGGSDYYYYDSEDYYYYDSEYYYYYDSK